MRLGLDFGCAVSVFLVERANRLGDGLPVGFTFAFEPYTLTTEPHSHVDAATRFWRNLTATLTLVPVTQCNSSAVYCGVYILIRRWLRLCCRQPGLEVVFVGRFVFLGFVCVCLAEVQLVQQQLNLMVPSRSKSESK